MNLSPEKSDLLVLEELNVSELNVSEIGIWGVAIASFIIGLWAGSLIFLFGTEIHNPLIVIISIIWQTFLYTGLFITAHDAIHQLVAPKHLKINRFFGSLALFLYSFFSYDRLLKAHWQHHLNPASEADPDFHDGEHKSAGAWYFYFMQRYWSWWRLVGLIVTYGILHTFLHIPHANLMVFWAIPLLLSSMQLFYFGTFLPHREPSGGYQNSLRTQSVYLPFLWSFLSCYHFGYHQEHHQYPNIPWWQLPAIAKVSMQSSTRNNLT